MQQESRSKQALGQMEQLRRQLPAHSVSRWIVVRSVYIKLLAHDTQQLSTTSEVFMTHLTEQQNQCHRDQNRTPSSHQAIKKYWQCLKRIQKYVISYLILGVGVQT
jgi:hypothetical protein